MSILRNLVIAFTLLVAGLLASSPASAACTGTAVHGGAGHACFGIAAGNWSNATTVWSATSGGGACSCTPATGDDVVLDGNSGTGTYTIDTGISLNSFDASAAGALTLVHNAVTWTTTGNFFSFSAAMTYTAASTARLVTFTGSVTLALTSAGKRFAAFTVNGTGTVTLQDAFRVDAVANTSNILTVTQGTFNDNGKTVTISTFASPNGATRTITKSGAWTVTGDDGFQTAWSMGTTATLTDSGSLTFNSTTTTTKSFATGSLTTYNVVTGATGTSNAAGLSISGSPTFATFNLTAPTNVYIAAAATVTVTNAMSWTGTSSNLINVRVNTGNGGTATLAVAASTASWIAFSGITFSGSTMTATNCFNLGGNNFNGGSCSVPSGGGVAPVINGSLMRHDLAPAANDNYLAWLEQAA